ADALSAAKRAEGLLTMGGSGDLLSRARMRRADLELIEQLDGVRIHRSEEKGINFDFEKGDAEYLMAFRAFGIDVDSLEPAEAARQIRERSVAVELAAALDDWAITRRSLNRPDVDWKRLLMIARAIDPDEWRTKLREALERRDQKALAEAAKSAQILELPPS